MKKIAEKLVGTILLISILFSIKLFDSYLGYRSINGFRGAVSDDPPMTAHHTSGTKVVHTIYLSKGKPFYPFFRVIGFLDSRLTGVQIRELPGLQPHGTELMWNF